MSDFELTFLGTGTSTGIPMIGCKCTVCTSDDPRDKRDRSSVYIKTPECAWVVDTGQDFRHQCLREDITELDAALFTHAHSDHIMGFDDLRRFTLPVDASLPVYANEHCMGMLKRIYEFAFNGENRYPSYLKPDPHVVHGPFTLGETEVTPLPVQHGKVQTNGYLFRRAGRNVLAYIPDCKEAHPETFPLVQDVETLVIDSLRYSLHPTHMNVDEAVAFAHKIGARKTYLTHFQCEVSHARLEQELPPGFQPAYDGLRLKL
ncbi:MAG: MBL fold metallo-hydrolase [Verrucomicrobiae bacterium]|nr:MBL fold metallo-hydrolase [Verrucomicrobiae bacterium]